MSLVNLLLGIRNAWRAERARRELHALSDRTLQDIGLPRSDIDSLFYSSTATACPSARVTGVTQGTRADTATQQSSPRLIPRPSM